MRCHSVCLWYVEPDAISNAINYAKFRSRSHNAVIRVFDEAGNLIGKQELAGDPSLRRFLMILAHSVVQSPNAHV